MIQNLTSFGFVNQLRIRLNMHKTNLIKVDVYGILMNSIQRLISSILSRVVYQSHFSPVLGLVLSRPFRAMGTRRSREFEEYIFHCGRTDTVTKKGSCYDF